MAIFFYFIYIIYVNARCSAPSQINTPPRRTALTYLVGARPQGEKTKRKSRSFDLLSFWLSLLDLNQRPTD